MSLASIAAALRKYTNTGSLTGLIVAVFGIVILFKPDLDPALQGKVAAAVTAAVLAIVGVISLADEIVHSAGQPPATAAPLPPPPPPAAPPSTGP